MKECLNCNNICEDDALFCTSCGQKFQDVEPAEASAFQTTVSQNTKEPNESYIDYYAKLSDENSGVIPAKSIFAAYIESFKNYFNFNGRARRSDYWPTILINVFLIIFVYIIVSIKSEEIGYIIFVVFAALLGIPTISVTVRRLHDADMHGAWIAVAIIPFFGWLAMLFLCSKDSNENANEYGPSPKYLPPNFMPKI